MEKKSEETIAVDAYQGAFTRYEEIQKSPEDDGKLQNLKDLETDLLRIIEEISGIEGGNTVISRIRESTYTLLADTRVHRAFLETDDTAATESVRGSVSASRKALNLAAKEKDLGYANFIRSGISFTLSHAFILSDSAIRQEIIDLLKASAESYDKTALLIKAANRKGISLYNTGTVLNKEFRDVKNLYERAYFLEQAQDSFNKAAEYFYTSGHTEFLDRSKKMAASLETGIKAIKSDPAYTGPVKRPAPRQEPDKPVMIPCPKCGTQNPEKAKFCAKCGAVMNPAPEPAPARTSMSCPKCGSPVTPGKKFCAKCGAPVSSPAAAAPAPVQVCPKCGSPVTPGKKFCAKCGERIA